MVERTSAWATVVEPSQVSSNPARISGVQVIKGSKKYAPPDQR